MDQPTRRGVLATLGLAATAGCTRLQNAIPGQDSSDLRGKTVEQVSETFTLDRGKFRSYPLSFDTRTVLTFSVVTDDNVDVLTFRRPAFREYETQSADQVSYVGELSEQNTTATAKGSMVSEGDPVVVIDNTSWGTTPPIPKIRVNVELEAFERA